MFRCIAFYCMMVLVLVLVLVRIVLLMLLTLMAIGHKITQGDQDYQKLYVPVLGTRV